ncbi:MAG: TM2 domain-containing protein [bacterium]
MSSYAPMRPTKYCVACQRTIDAEAAVCTSCGVMQPYMPSDESEKRILPAALLCFLFGIFGAHRFYVGRTSTAVVQLLTLGGLGIWAMIDLILIIAGAFKDGDGNRIIEWT